MLSKDYDNVSKTGMKDKGGKSLHEKGCAALEVAGECRTRYAATYLDSMRADWKTSEGANRERESEGERGEGERGDRRGEKEIISAASKRELIRGCPLNKSLHISREVTSCRDSVFI